LSNDAQLLVQTLLLLAVSSALIVAANYADKRGSASLRHFVVAALALINIGVVVIIGLPPLVAAYAPDVLEYDIGRGAAWLGFILSLVTAGLGLAILSPVVRARIAVLFPRPRPRAELVGAPAPSPYGTPLFPQMLNYYTTESTPALQDGPPPPAGDESPVRGFDPASTVHMTALALVILMLGVQTVNFVIGGGLQGVAQLYEEGISALTIVLNEVPFLVAALLGVGLGVRRTLPAALDRLGLHVPTAKGLSLALAAAIGLIVLVGLISAVWQSVVSEETFKEQTQASDALAQSVDSLWLAFLIAAAAGIGEETAFRGALQPVFGLWPTAIIFALTHAQYTLTPATLIILVVAVAFGYLRRHFSTTVCIVAHFTYNFIPLALATAVDPQAVIAFLRLLF